MAVLTQLFVSFSSCYGDADIVQLLVANTPSFDEIRLGSKHEIFRLFLVLREPIQCYAFAATLSLTIIPLMTS